MGVTIATRDVALAAVAMAVIPATQTSTVSGVEAAAQNAPQIFDKLVLNAARSAFSHRDTLHITWTQSTVRQRRSEADSISARQRLTTGRTQQLLAP